MADTPEEFADLKQLVIEPEEITFLVQEMAERHREDGSADFYTGMAILAERYKDDRDRAVCISFRMRCFAPMMSDERMRGWSFEHKDDPECTVTSGAVFRAVAKCPMRSVDEHLTFDPDEFFELVLGETEPEALA